MKRYVMLFTFTFIVAGFIAAYGLISRNSVVEVSTVKVDTLTVENSVTCSGRVERIDTSKVYAPSASVVKDVYVKAGDHVITGQALMTVELPSDKIDTSQLPNGYESLLNQYKDQLQSAQSSYEATIEKTVSSPVSGEITSVSVAPNSYISGGSPVAVIADDSGLQVRLSVYESQISDIKVGQKAIITGVGFKNSTYSGTVKSISSEAKQIVTTTGQETVVEVIVSVEGSSQDIKPGFTAKARIITSENSGVLIAPYEAVRADKNGNEYVYKIAGKQAVKTPIVTKKEFDNGFEVVSGLSKNDIIINDPDNVSNGAYVKSSEKKAVSSDE
ncbi:MAG TPA: HlyD family efflux transporter periplasmic adaptor subunit [Ruminiclostridium sp.]|nr:HlyD family efflux transporter periplasmic adaptor subunit [Ruminiclostridium sp.]